MYSILKKRSKQRPEKLGGKLLTLPGLYVKPYEALKQYTDKSFEERAAQAFSDEGQPIPNFEMMDKIERLEALSEWRGIALDEKAKLDRRNAEAKEAYEKNEYEKLIKQRVDNELAKQQQSAKS